ncbi:MAG: peptidoglycan bridge formation glycyltransferase FemA/FemB family protein [Candidatus Aminicenantes bacterium]|nr:peptidoglycan bridge formation glycyltransferase FemA/FemB family protein [Candidatus Aminicenantes bacterium]
MEIKIIDPSRYYKWNTFIINNFDPDVFHSSEWCLVLKSTYNFLPNYFLFSKDDQPLAVIPLMEIQGFIIGSRAVGLPFTDYCNPLKVNNLEILSLRKDIINYGQNKKWNYVEFRTSLFAECQPPYETYYTHDIDLTISSNKLWTRLKSNNKRNIKKAIKLGLRIQFEKSTRALEDFYRLQVITRKRHGLPPQPFKFFKNVFENIILKKLGIIACTYYKNKMIAASIFFNFNHKAVFKYGASDHLFHQLRPNNLIMWEAINWHRENGCQLLNLGRTHKEDKGLLEYKRSWGGNESELRYFRFLFNKNRYIRSPLINYNLIFSSIGKCLPLPLLKLIGKHCYRQFA